MDNVMTAENFETDDSIISPVQERPVIVSSDAGMDIKMTAEGVSVFYGDKQALDDISIDIHSKQITALIGPSGCGKTTFLRCLNRMNDVVDGCRITGRITMDGDDIYAPKVDVVSLRGQVGMVFQKPNPFPKTIYDNVAYGPKIHGLAANKSELDEIVQQSLQRAALWVNCPCNHVTCAWLAGALSHALGSRSGLTFS